MNEKRFLYIIQNRFTVQRLNLPYSLYVKLLTKLNINVIFSTKLRPLKNKVIIFFLLSFFLFLLLDGIDGTHSY